MDTGEAQTSAYTKFRILVDDPVDDPALGFQDYADAFAEIVTLSPPRFAVGIFGSWGSGKTTLMRAIWKRIEDREDVIPVWFNAWRYEREEHLIVPLLDVVREAVVKWADEREREGKAPKTLMSRARGAAAAMGTTARAIASGISVSANVPGVPLTLGLDLEKVLASGASEEDAVKPASLYHASFVAMADAVHGFVTSGARRRRDGSEPVPKRRIVVFIDDLDRCLPLNALSVLESMKLFFDLEGFVFVAGLDQQVIERAIEIRYADPRERADEEPAAPTNGEAPDGPARSVLASQAGVINGRDYTKKIFQVPFGLPTVDRTQLEELVSVLVEERPLESAQRRDLTGRILKHLRYFSDERGVNPREIKRLINAYTLQAKLMSLKLPKVDPGAKVDLDTILALQVIAFRPDWERIWRRLEADPDGFVSRLNRELDEKKEDIAWVDGEPLPPRLVDYLTKGPAGGLRRNEQLKVYLTSSQASHISQPLILQAQAAVDDLRRFISDVGVNTDRGGLSAALHAGIDALKSSLTESTWARDLIPVVARLERDASLLAAGGPDGPAVPLGEWVDNFRARLDRLDNDLQDLRDRFSLRAP
jgi:hypothetical protein